MSTDPGYNIDAVLAGVQAGIGYSAQMTELNYLVISRLPKRTNAKALASMIASATKVVPRNIQICVRQEGGAADTSASSHGWGSDDPPWEHLKSDASSDLSSEMTSSQESSDKNRMVTKTPMYPDDQVALVEFRSTKETDIARGRLSLSPFGRSWRIDQISNPQLIHSDLSFITKWMN